MHQPIKILVVVGTRPEAIKMAPVIYALKKRSEQFTCRVCATAQHRDMLDQVLDLFSIQPDYDLNVMQTNQTLSQVTIQIITKLEPIIKKEMPDWVLVEGDTTTVMVAALIGFYHQVKIGHIEAGLRTWNKYRPFPEEVNRKIVSSFCDLHFAPTTWAKNNLLREGISEQQIVITGNTVIDALLTILDKKYDWNNGPLRTVNRQKKVILVTVHRRENFGRPLQSICKALLEIAQSYSDKLQIVYPVHLNPNLRKPVYKLLSKTGNILLLDPLDYHSLVNLMSQAFIVVTDSGGIQEEAPSLGKPVLVLRDVTERPEGIEAGTTKLIGTEHETIVREISNLLNDDRAYQQMIRAVSPYGDGQASARIVKSILYFNNSTFA